jgi:hypothetical protein
VAAKLSTLEQLAHALDDGAARFELDGKLADLISKAKRQGAARTCAELARIFDKGQHHLDRELHSELGHEVPQQAKDMMREKMLAAMEKTIDAVLAAIAAYDTTDERTYRRR